MNFKELKEKTTQPEVQSTTIKIYGDTNLEIRGYLPIEDKIKLIQEIIDESIDSAGWFSPVRVEVCSSLAIAKYYAGLDVDIEDRSAAYDWLEITNTFNQIESAIDEGEIKFLKDLIEETIRELSNYNHSFAGTLSTMSQDTTNLDAQFSNILKQIKDREGMEQLAVIKDMVGTD